MAKEVLAVPEQFLGDVIKIIRAGLGVYEEVMVPEIDPDVIYNLTKWFNDEEEYLKSMEE